MAPVHRRGHYRPGPRGLDAPLVCSVKRQLVQSQRYRDFINERSRVEEPNARFPMREWQVGEDG